MTTERNHHADAKRNAGPVSTPRAALSVLCVPAFVFAFLVSQFASTPSSAASSAFADSVFAEPAVGATVAAPASTLPFAGAPSPLLLKELRDLHARSGVGGELALSIRSTRHQRFEARWNDTVPFVPASTLKLVVTAAALDAVPDDAPHTTLEVAGRIRGRTLHGELRLHGGGDPNISDRFYDDAVTPLLAWADSLRTLGIDTVRGRVTASEAYFEGPRRPDVWHARHFEAWYGAEVSALSFNDNAYEITVGPGARAGEEPRVVLTPDVGHVRVLNRARTVYGTRNRLTVTQQAHAPVAIVTGTVGAGAAPRKWLLPVRDPAGFFRAGFLTALSERGITVVDAAPPADAPVLRTLRFSAAPLASLVDEVNQRSQNLHAELLLRHLGRAVSGEGSARAGIAAEHAFLARMGLDSNAFELHDASGLSHRNRVEARALALLLDRMTRHPQRADYVASLAQPGVDGATGKRLRDYAGSGLVRYKTGSLNGVAGLAGYAFAADGDTLAVAMLLNGFTSGSASAGALLDTLFMRSALWFNKERPALALAHRLLADPAAPPPGAPGSHAARLRHFSKALRGSPYFLGPTGEGRFADADPLPLLDLSRMDCVTYMENALALARARSAADVLPALLPFRYHGDTVRFAARNHYFAGEWVPNNPRDFRVLEIPGDTVHAKTLHRAALLAGKGIEGDDLEVSLRYVPYERALELARNWTLGPRFLGVAFMTARDGLDATHTGFLDAMDGAPVLRHASQLQGRVTDQNFAEYLESRRGRCSGVLFFEFLAP